jgi:hypothetical protein
MVGLAIISRFYFILLFSSSIPPLVVKKKLANYLQEIKEWPRNAHITIAVPQ